MATRLSAAWALQESSFEFLLRTWKDFAVDDFDEQAVDGAAAGGDLLEDVGALALVLDSGADAL